MSGAQLSHGELFRPDLTRLLPAKYLFNPTIISWSGALWMIYRRVNPQPGLTLVEWPRTLAMCRLGTDLEADVDSNVDLSARIEDAPGARHWHADPRLFMREDGPWMSYHDNNDIYVLPIQPGKLAERLPARRIVLADRIRRRQERNWGLFDDGAFKALYTIDPTVVLELERTGNQFDARTVCEGPPHRLWDAAQWGDPHGGSSPVLVGSCWFVFFSSNKQVDTGSEQRIYSMGFLGFDAKPPYRILYMSPYPIFSAASIEGPRSFYCDHAVIYPAGALFDRGRWLVSVGIHDRALGFIAFDHDHLLAECDPT